MGWSGEGRREWECAGVSGRKVWRVGGGRVGDVYNGLSMSRVFTVVVLTGFI